MPLFSRLLQFKSAKITSVVLFAVLSLFVSCSKELDKSHPKTKKLTIFFVNDQHGQIDNFSKIKHIVDEEKLKTDVIVACS